MSATRRPRQDGFKPKVIALSVAACFSLSATQSFANPTGGTVTSGGATFAASGNTLTIANTANAIINWQSFSIGVNEITKFLQSSAGSAVLNRVTGAGGVIPKSFIDGILQSNGRVFLLNQSGIAIGSTATIDVAGFVASSLNLSDSDFQNGRMHFTEVAGAGKVSNAGLIDTTNAGPGGRVFLVGPDVENSGIIRTPQGQIVLAAGKSVDLVQENSPFVTVKVTADSEQALNLGSLISDSGRIDMAGALVRNSGVISANSAVVGANGEIRLVATKDVTLDAGSSTTANGPGGGNVLVQAQTGTALVYGNVSATGSSGTGGTIQALGVRVGVLGNGVIDASGDAGGGTVLVGGDQHGANPNVQNAQQTLIGPDGVIRADAGTTGDGGRVIVWSDQYTQFYGNISARGGSQSGNGGFVETSGEQTLTFAGLVNTSAPMGMTGTLLLDPDSITITHGPTDTDITSTPNTPAFTNTSTDTNPAILSDGTINTQLSTNNVIVTTSTGDIVIDTNGVAIAPTTGANSFSLSLNSGGAITWSSPWSYTNTGALNLTAATFIQSTGTTPTLSLNGSSPLSLTANNGSIILGGAIVTQGGSVTMAVPTIDSITGGSVATITTNGGAVTLSAPFGSVGVGNIDTTTATPGTTDTSVSINSASGVATGSINTGNTTGNYSSVFISAGSGNISTGAITTGDALDYSSVQLNASAGTISTGTIHTGDATFDSYIDLFAATGIRVTDLTTGNTSSSNPSSTIDLTTTTGGVTTGNILTGTADDGSSGNSSVRIQASSSGPILTGTITTGNAGFNSSVSLNSVASNVSTSSIRTGNLSSYYGDSSVNIFASTGISVSGDIFTGSNTPNSISFGNGESLVNLTTSSGGINIGNITTGISDDGFGDGRSYVSLNTGGVGDISTVAITTGSAGDDSHVSVTTNLGNITTGAVHTGNAGISTLVSMSSGGYGIITGDITTGSTNFDSEVRLFASTGIATGNISTGSAADGSEGSSFVSLRNIGVGNITTGSISTGGVGNDASVFIEADAGNISTGTITTGNALNFSYVLLEAPGSITTSTVQTGNTDGGEGSVDMSASGSISTGSIFTSVAGANTSNRSFVSLSSGLGSVSTGSITTGTATSDSSVSINAYGSIGTLDINTGIAGNQSLVNLHAGSGVNTGNISTGNADGGEGTTVEIFTTTGGVTTGSITTGSSEETWVSVVANAGNILTGAISTGAAGNDNDVFMQAVAGNITTGPISTGNAGFFSYVDLIASGSISTGGGAVNTGNTDGGEGSVRMQAGTGISTGPINTSPTGAFTSNSSFVNLSTSAGNINTGAITTGPATSDSHVDLESPVTGSITTGAISTGNSGSLSWTLINAYGGSVSTGAIATGSSLDSDVNLIGNGGILTGAINTSNSVNASWVSLNASTGGNVTAGAITTGASADSSVSVSTPSGTVTTGNISTGNPTSSSGVSWVFVSGTGNVSTGSITTGALGSDSDIDVESSLGSITTGAIATGSATDFSYVLVDASGGSITTNGGIAVAAGASLDDSLFLFGGTGNVTVSGPISATTLGTFANSGNVTLGNPANNIGVLLYSSATGIFSISTANAMTITGPVIAGTSFQWTAGAPLTLDQPTFFNLVSAPLIQVASAGAIALSGAVTPLASTLSLAGTGGVTQAGPLTVTNLTVADSAGNITLMDPANSIGNLSVTTPANAAVENGGVMNVMSSSVGGQLSLVSDISPTASGTVTAGALLYTSASPGTVITPSASLLSFANAPVVQVGTTANTGGISLPSASLGASELDLFTSGPITAGPISAANLSAAGQSLSFTGTNNVSNFLAVATSGGLTFSNSGSLNAGVTVPGAVALTSGGNITGFALDSATTLTAGGAIGSPTLGFFTATGSLSAQAVNGINIDMISGTGLPVPVSQLRNTGTGDILLNAHGGVITNSLVSDPGGNVTINTFSPMTIGVGITSGGSISLSTGGDPLSLSPAPNDMTLTGPFTYNTTTGKFEVTIGLDSALFLNPPSPATQLVLTAAQFPNPFQITEFTFLTAAGALPPAVNSAIDSGTGATNQSTTPQGTLGSPDDNKKKDDNKKGAATCK